MDFWLVAGVGRVQLLGACKVGGVLMTDWDEMVADMGPGCPFRPHCEGPYERHHAIPKQTIRGHYHWWRGLTEQHRAAKGLPVVLPLLEEALADRRNLLVLCKGHHELVSGHRIYVTREMLPDGVDAFAAELGVSWFLERTFDRDEAA